MHKTIQTHIHTLTYYNQANQTKRLNKSIVTFFSPFLSIKFRFRCVHKEWYCYANVRWALQIKLFLSLERISSAIMSNSWLILLYTLSNLNRKIALNLLNLQMTSATTTTMMSNTTTTTTMIMMMLVWLSSAVILRRMIRRGHNFRNKILHAYSNVDWNLSAKSRKLREGISTATAVLTLWD